MAIIDLQKKIVETEGRLKQQQNLYEAVRSDRNLYSKNLIESQDEIQEMKRKFKIMNHQIEQLKEEISSKDLALVKEHFEHMKASYLVVLTGEFCSGWLLTMFMVTCYGYDWPFGAGNGAT